MWIRSDPDFKTGCADPDPNFKNRIRGSGSENNGPDPQHWIKSTKLLTSRSILDLYRATILV